MKILAKHIEYLLTLHDCVIVPDFGGFILRYQPAMFESDGKIIPPSKVVGFNPILKYNDGLLANSIMRELNISFQDAMNQIHAEVRSFQCLLKRDQWTELGEIGLFKYTENGQVDFMPAETNSFDLNLFGLSEIQLVPIQANLDDNSHQSDSATTQSSNNDVVMVPINVRILRHAVAVAAMIVGLLFVSHPLEKENILSNYASLVSSGLIKNTLFPQVSQKDMRDASDYCMDSSLWMSQDFTMSVLCNDTPDYIFSQFERSESLNNANANENEDQAELEWTENESVAEPILCAYGTGTLMVKKDLQRPEFGDPKFQVR